MPTRRTGVLTALLLTAALMCAMPGLWQSFWHTDENRMDESLRPARMRTVTVWLLPSEMEDRKCIAAACSAFEKEHRGVRIFLRNVTPDELTARDAVLPDAVLFEPGSILNPQAALLPLQMEDLSDGCGLYALERYAVPLWLEPYVLTLPQSGLRDGEPLWMQLAAGLELPQGLALQQLLFTCPAQLRGELVRLCTQESVPTPTPVPAAVWSTTMPLGRSAPSTAAPDQGTPARVQTLRRHLLSGADTGVILRPAVSDRVRCVGLCRDNEDAKAFLMFLMEWPADVDGGILPLHASVEAYGLAGEALEFYRQGTVLPNAFSHTAQERKAVCLDAFRRAEDPAQTILRLR